MEGNKTDGKSTNYVELVTLKYSGLVPKPFPACEEPTPEEQYRQHISHKQQELDEREERYRVDGGGMTGSSSMFPASNGGGFFSSTAGNLRHIAQKVALKVERASTEVTSATETQLRQIERQLNSDRFKKNFPELSSMGEVLLADYACFAMHGGLRVCGRMQITKNFLCFSEQKSSAISQAATAVLKETGLVNDSKSPGIRQIIPLSEIACIQPSVFLETVDRGPPFFLPIPAPDVLPTSLQLYTTKQKLFQFFGFESMAATARAALSDSVKGRPIDHAYNYLDHAWRAATIVPLQGVNYDL